MSEDYATTLPRGANIPESVRMRLLAAQLLQQSAAQQERPYTSKGVVALKALSGLLGGIQERQALQGEDAAQAAHRTALASLLMSGASSGAMGAGGATPTSTTSSAYRAAGSDAVASGTARNPSGYDPKATEALIRSRAPAFGVDPDTAVRIARSEGLNVYHGDGGSSFGPFQLHYGGVAGGGNAVGGLGDAFTKKTGLDARDPSTVPQQVDFALSQAAQGGWGPWHGRKTPGVDIGLWDGIGPNYKGPTTTQARAASADAPAPNAQPVSSTTLPPGITPDMIGGPGDRPSPYGALPTLMAQPVAAPDTAALATALRGMAGGSGPGATPLPATTQPSSPFGAMPQPMNQAPATPPSPQTAALVAALRQRAADSGAPAPAALAPPTDNPAAPPSAVAAQDPTARLGPLSSFDMNGIAPGSPLAMTSPTAGSGLAASGLSTPNMIGFDNFSTQTNPDGTPQITQSSLGAAGFTGSLNNPATPDAPADPVSTALLGNLRGPDGYVGGDLGLGTPSSTPAAPSIPPALMAAALRQRAAPNPMGPTSSPSPAPMSAPTSPPTPPAQVAALPNPDDPIGGLMGAPNAPKASVADLATAAMAKAGYDTSALPQPPGPPAGATPPLPILAAPNVPPPGLTNPATPPAVAAMLAPKPTVAAAAMRSGSLATVSPEPNTKPSETTGPGAELPETGPMPPPRPSDTTLGLNPDAPAPNAVPAGPAPLTNPLARLLAQPQPQPMGLAGNSPVSDPSSAQNFTRQDAARASGEPSPSMLARVLDPSRNASPAAVSTSAPASGGGQDSGGPLDAIGRLLGGLGGQGGGLGSALGNLPIIGGLIGGVGPSGQGAGSPNVGGQGQAVPFTPGGQGPQPTQAGAGQAPSGLGGMSQQQAIALLSDPRTSPQEAQIIMSRAFPQPIIEQTKDGRIVSIDPRGGPAKVLYAGQGYRPATADERRSYGITDDRPFTFGPDGKPEIGTVDPNARETNEQRDYHQVVQEAQNAGQKPPSFADYQTSLRHAGSADPGPAGMVFGAIKEQRDGAMAAAQALPSFQQANAAIKSGAILGAGADQRLSVAKALSLFGYQDQGNAAANTEVFRSAVAPVVLSTVKSLGAGSGISNADRDFAEKAAGGNINLEPEAIKRLLDIGERAANAKVAAYNATLDGTYPASEAKNGQVRQLFQLRMPDAGGPAGQASAAPTAPATPPAPMPAPAAPQGGGYLPGANRSQAATGAASAQAVPAPSDAIAQAQAAIARGAPRAAVIQRLQAAGINPAGL